jgi:glycosyltransferase involved in cell wall biosynthesis
LRDLSQHECAAPVSAIVPVRNCELYIAEALRSALAQPELMELIVVDDGSTDATEQRVREFADDRIRILRQETAGAAAARNTGAALATGDFLAFLDADDVWLDGKLARQIEALRSGADLAFCLVEEFVSPGLDPAAAARLRPHPGAMPGLSNSTIVVPRAVFERVGPYDPNAQVGEFMQWYARAQDLGLRSVTVPEVLARRRLHLTNMGRTNHDIRFRYASVLKEMLDRRRAEPTR